MEEPLHPEGFSQRMYLGGRRVYCGRARGRLSGPLYNTVALNTGCVVSYAVLSSHSVNASNLAAVDVCILAIFYRVCSNLPPLYFHLLYPFTINCGHPEFRIVQTTKSITGGATVLYIFVCVCVCCSNKIV
jgi:hypothetical protein